MFDIYEITLASVDLWLKTIISHSEFRFEATINGQIIELMVIYRSPRHDSTTHRPLYQNNSQSAVVKRNSMAMA